MSGTTVEARRAIDKGPVRVALGRRVAAGLLAGGILATGFPPYTVPLLLPVGIAVLRGALRGATVREAVYAGLACGAVYFGATLFWLGNLFGTASISLIAIAAAFIGVFGGLLAWLERGNPRIPLAALAPGLWVAVEYYRSELFALNFGWMGLGYGVVNSPLLAGLAPWIGSYGLSLVIVMAGVLLLNPRWRIPAALVWTGAVFLPMASPPVENPLRVRLAQAFSGDEEELFRRSAPGSAPVDVILWPEYSLNEDPRRDPKRWERLQRVARENRCVFIFGAKDQFDPRDEASYRNTAFVLGADGELIGTHVKNHTVHFVRDGIRGMEARAIDTPAGRLGVAICFDMDYPDVARRLAADGAEVFLVPNMDPGEWGAVQREQHRLMFQMRAAECGKWLARADVAGGTSAAAPNCREAARVNTSEPTTLDVWVGRNGAITPYVRGGWVLPRVCLVAILALAGFSAMRGGSRRLEIPA